MSSSPNVKLISKLLIANRGEIACRVARTAKKMGIETIAIYSDIDRNSRHVEMCDRAYHVGPSPASQSYLNSSKIMEIAKDCNAEAVHPGFGFLSENAEFADDCSKNGLIFIGPPSSAIRSMGSKSESKKIMTKANVPVVGGYFGEDQDKDLLMSEAKKIGFPVLIKAVSGGGGKGMRIVHSEEEFFDSLESCKREALKSFKDDRVLVEKYITKPRHIEFQIMGDKYSNYVYLFERDCSIQRRHQKVIEEAPSNLSWDLREKIGKSAVDAARAVGYVNAGTVEFIFDTETNQYYFMEMNTRLQVEHPITEMITQKDLVELQLLVGSGFKLPFKQDDLKIHGHAIEARIYSEDPYNKFLPGNGKLKYLREPETDGKTVRLDSGVREGDEISIFYDPMIAKLITWGKDRQQATNIMHAALNNYRIVGLPNNVNFLKRLVELKEFSDWDYDTSFISQYEKKLLQRKENLDEISLLTTALLKAGETGLQPVNGNKANPFQNFRVNHSLKKSFNFTAKLVQSQAQAGTYKAEVEYASHETVNVKITGPDGKTHAFSDVRLVSSEENKVKYTIGSRAVTKEFYQDDCKLWVFDNDGDVTEIELENEKKLAQSTVVKDESKDKFKAPMPGTLIKLYVKEGDQILKGANILTLEAMKMEHTVKAPANVKITKVYSKQGAFVDAGATIVAFEEIKIEHA
eukprot:CAMPEP_0176463474 /NCGR_PEP_ID=MMETSP0127-20121128/35907_1 /TAXON_ID=938130 /ORGANISM="Platyophrya macrostoma, Strain WH" /LENGTH=689 /DNA_ID=CAMNT_0017855635 /DNA_START=19 /DNA_END=2088 /DNA_ORIENTATION=-